MPLPDIFLGGKEKEGEHAEDAAHEDAHRTALHKTTGNGTSVSNISEVGHMSLANSTN